MNKYVWHARVKGKQVFYAWSEMPCKRNFKHDPHSWNSELVSYGPYMCWGGHKK